MRAPRRPLVPEERVPLVVMKALLFTVVLSGLILCSCQPPLAPIPEERKPQAEALPEEKLPAEGLREKDRLAFLFTEITMRFPCEVKDQVNEMLPRVHTVTFAEELGPIDGELVIQIPADVVRVWKLFTSLDIHGSGLGLHGQEVTFDTPQGEYHFDFWRKDDVMLSGHASKMVISDGDEDYKGYRMIVKGQGRIDRILLRNGGGVSAFFDDGPWSTLGKDRPVEPVEILVDATNRRAIGGSVRLEREKFWRVASHNNAHPGGLLAAEYCAERGFFPGRGIWKLDGLTHWGYGGRVLKENPKKRGVPVYSDFDGLELDVETKETREDAFPRDFKHANCFDNWPPFMALQNTRAKNHRGTPADFQEAAKLASAAIGWQKAVDGRNDFWWEVKNESTITEEWVLHGEEGVDSWGKLAEFHNIMADAIRSAHPDVLVGGPASAWMALHHADFDLARKQLRFMDETRGHLDFYSHHFYEGKELVLSAGDSYPQGYLMGRLEGCLDLLSSHMVITDNVRPFLISETGTLSDRTTELGIWLNTKNMSSYLMRYIKYPDRIDLVNLWLVPYAWWDKNGHELFNPDESGKLVVDERVGYLLELWRDFRGDRLPYRIQSQATDVHVHTVVDGKTIWVAINNLNAHRIAADISLLAGDATVQRVEQLRLYFDRAKIKFETHTRRGLTALPVAVEETSLVKITLDRAPQTGDVLDERTYYGDRTIQATGEDAEFEVALPSGEFERAQLRVCVSRNGGFRSALSVAVNGTEVCRDQVITAAEKTGNYWGAHTIEMPAALLAQSNAIRVMIPEEGGYVTSVALITTTRLIANSILEPR